MKEAVVVIVILVLVFLMEPLIQFGTVEAQYPFSNPTIFIHSPAQQHIYQTTSVPIVVTVMPWETGKKFGDIYYTLDGEQTMKLSITTYATTTDLDGKGTLENLTDGYHTIKAFSTDTQGETLWDSKTFLVNTTIIFPTLLLSPLNTTYNTKDIPLTYTIDNSKYTGYYSLDNSGDKLLDSNTTLAGLSEGQHTIIARATNGTEIYSKQTINFTINTTSSFPISPLNVQGSLTVGAAILVLVIVAFVAVYYERYKRHFH